MSTPERFALFLGLVCFGPLSGCSKPAGSPSTPNSPAPGQSEAQQQDAPSAPDEALQFEVDTPPNVEGPLTLRAGESSLEVRYIETERVDEATNYPKVVARFEVHLAQQWRPLLELQCHDSYDDCGTASEDLSCPVIEESTLDATSLRDLATHFGSSAPSSARLAVEAIGRGSPIAHCMARLFQAQPDDVGFVLEDLYDALAEAKLEELWAMKERAQSLWQSDKASAVAALNELDVALSKLELQGDALARVYHARVLIDASLANASEAVPTPIIRAKDELVRWE